MNIWSHLLGFLLFLGTFFFLLVAPPETVRSHVELAPILVQLFTYQVGN